MSMNNERPVFSVITPTAGKRPKALALAVASVAKALKAHPATLEMLIGLDGCPEKQALAALPEVPNFVRVFRFPGWGDFGNRVRNALMRAATGAHFLFLDDDNAYLPRALRVFAETLDADIAVARIDVSRAFGKQYLPEEVPGEPLVRQCNVDPLCLRVSRELALTRCGGWGEEGGYESDFLNIARYFRRAKTTAFSRELVGIYDAGRSLDPDGENPRQRQIVKHGCFVQ